MLPHADVGKLKFKLFHFLTDSFIHQDYDSCVGKWSIYWIGGDNFLAKRKVKCTTTLVKVRKATVNLIDLIVHIIKNPHKNICLFIDIKEISTNIGYIYNIEMAYYKEATHHNSEWKMFSGLIDAVQYLHNIGYVHRDIKELNVLYVKNRAILIDLDHAVKIGTKTNNYGAQWYPKKMEKDYITEAYEDIYSLYIMFIAHWNKMYMFDVIPEIHHKLVQSPYRELLDAMTNTNISIHEVKELYIKTLV